MKLNRILLAIALVLALGLTACGEDSEEYTKIEPALVEPIDGTVFNRVTLTERAAERLEVQTRPVAEEQVDGNSRLVVPYAAIIYDINGGTWVYTNPAPLTFVRAPITIDFIDGDKVYLHDGPALGTEVATVAVAELFGTDTGVGK